MEPQTTTSTEQPRPNAASTADGFAAFGLDPAIRGGIDFAGFIHPRPVQVGVIPPALQGRDILGLAQTGTGKTAAFALPILDRLNASSPRRTSVLVLAPTRELASQISAEITELGQFTAVRSTTVYGGVSIRRQVTALAAKPEILVACPGRLLDLHRQRAVDLSKIETVVIDEADHMFDLGFLPDVREILRLLTSRKQTMLFSATMPREIRGLADSLLNDPAVVDLGHSKVVSTIDHELYPVAQEKRFSLLNHLLDDPSFTSAIVFTRTKHRATRLARQLRSAGHNSVALQGNMSQNQRDRAMAGFRNGDFQVLVATDIAARGIDVAGVSHVINFDFPNTPDAYIHRIGRTGRSEQAGRAFTLVIPDDAAAVRALERKLGRKVNRCVLPEFAGTTSDDEEQPQQDVGRPSRGSVPQTGELKQRQTRNRRPPRSHSGHQSTRSKRSRSRHRRHAERASRA